MTINPELRLSDEDLAVLAELSSTNAISFDHTTVQVLLTEIEELKSELEGADQTIDLMTDQSAYVSMSEIKMAGLERAIGVLEEEIGLAQANIKFLEEDKEGFLKDLVVLKARLAAKDKTISRLESKLMRKIA